MRVMRRIVFLVAALMSAITVSRAQTPQAPLDAAFRAFWDADNPAAAERLTDRIVSAGASFDAIEARLKAGRPYAKQKSGRVPFSSTVDGMTLDNVAEVPDDYDAAHPLALRVSLHGGVGRPAPARGEQLRPLTNRIPGDREIVLHPRSWADLEWWKAPAVDNILRLVDRVKRAYNVDESHIYLTGISDGGTGVYYLAMKAATLWSSCLPLNGQPLVIANPDTGAEGELYATNLVNCPLHAVNGGRDRLYPAASVKPLIDMFNGGGIPILWQVFPDADHDTSWWPQEKSRYTEFVATHARVAHPPTISWTTERTDRYNRFRWLVIDRLGERKSDTALKDANTFDVGGRRAQLFQRRRPAGRVDVTRTANSFDVKTRGVAEFTLLLSRDVIDFAKPVQVTVNGHSAHDAMVKLDPAALVRWAARDNDRTMLYAAELKITVP
jgi:poly(3-hydroxybutyrate) depolymerase